MAYDSALYPRPAATRPDAAGHAPLLWFIAALAIMLLGQVARLYQTEAAWWLACDYGWRLAVITMLSMTPAIRAILYPSGVTNNNIFYGLFAVLILTIVGIIGGILLHFPGMGFGEVPRLSAPLRALDFVIGIPLVAYSEELLFRRGAFHILRKYLGGGALLTFAAGVIFAFAHWSAGFPTMISAMIFGIVAMMFFKRMGVIWPMVLAHSIVDFYAATS